MDEETLARELHNATREWCAATPGASFVPWDKLKPGMKRARRDQARYLLARYTIASKA